MDADGRVDLVFGSLDSWNSNGTGSWSLSKNTFRELSGRRIVEIQILNECLSSSMCCNVCHGSIQLVDERNIEGLSSSLIWKCSICFQEIIIPTSSFIK